MNKILVFFFMGICLMVIGSCQSNKKSTFTSTSVSYSGSTLSERAFGKKACQGEDPKKWNNCGGQTLFWIGGDGYVTNAVYKNGKKNGKALSSRQAGAKVTHCEENYKNDKLNGLQVCEIDDVEVSRAYYVNGVKSDKAAKRLQTASYSKECTGLGFKKGTGKHGECILKLREIAVLEKSSNRGQTKILISDVKKQTSDLDKLAGLAMMLNGLKEKEAELKKRKI